MLRKNASLRNFPDGIESQAAEANLLGAMNRLCGCESFAQHNLGSLFFYRIFCD